MTKDIHDLPASVRARLLNVARARGEEFELVLVHYGIERLLYRLSRSEYSKRFVLKGAMLYVAWGIDGHRSTRDVDFLGYVSADPVDLTRIFREICRAEVELDGIAFDPDSVNAGYIREETEYGGIRITLTGEIARARVPL